MTSYSSPDRNCVDEKTVSSYKNTLIVRWESKQLGERTP